MPHVENASYSGSFAASPVDCITIANPLASSAKGRQRILTSPKQDSNKIPTYYRNPPSAQHISSSKILLAIPYYRDLNYSVSRDSLSMAPIPLEPVDGGILHQPSGNIIDTEVS